MAASNKRLTMSAELGKHSQHRTYISPYRAMSEGTSVTHNSNSTLEMRKELDQTCLEKDEKDTELLMNVGIKEEVTENVNVEGDGLESKVIVEIKDEVEVKEEALELCCDGFVASKENTSVFGLEALWDRYTKEEEDAGNTKDKTPSLPKKLPAINNSLPSLPNTNILKLEATAEDQQEELLKKSRKEGTGTTANTETWTAEGTRFRRPVKSKLPGSSFSHETTQTRCVALKTSHDSDFEMDDDVQYVLDGELVDTDFHSSLDDDDDDDDGEDDDDVTPLASAKACTEMSSNATNWSEDDVGRWLVKIGLGDYAQNFMDNGVDGETLLMLTERQKERLIGHIRKEITLSKAIEDLYKSGCVGVEDKTKAAVQSTCARPGPSHKPDLRQPRPKRERRAPPAIDEQYVEDDILNPDDLRAYKLPVFPSKVSIILLGKKTKQDYLAGTHNRRAVIDAITSDLQKKNILVLSKKGYTSIINALFREYPYIGDPKSWRKSLRTKMKQIRLSQTAPIMMYMKEKYGRPRVPGKKRSLEHEDSEAYLSKRAKRCPLSDVSDGYEDDGTIKQHIVTLKVEFLKGVPDGDLVECKLQKTFNYRKALLYNPETSISDVLEEFPVLRQRNFIKLEAQRYGIMPVTGIQSKFLGSLLEFVKYGKQRCKKFKKYFSLYEDFEDSTNEADKDESAVLLGLQLLPSMFKEDEELLICDSVENIKFPSPVIVSEGGQYQIYINGAHLLTKKIKTISDAIECLFHSYFVFAQEYPETLTKTLLFLERYVFQHQVKIPANVASWAKRLDFAD